MRVRGELRDVKDVPEGSLVELVCEVVRQDEGNQTLMLSRGSIGHSGTWSVHHGTECSLLAGPTSLPMIQERKEAVQRQKVKKSRSEHA